MRVLGPDSVGLARAELGRDRRRRRARRRGRARPRRRAQLRGLHQRGRGRGGGGGGPPRERRGARGSWPPRRPPCSTCRATTCSTVARARPISSPIRPDRCRATGARSSRARSRPRRPTRATSWCAPSWLFGAGGRQLRGRRCCAWARERDEVRVVADQVGCPTYTGHLAHALVRMAGRRGLRRAPRRGHGRLLLVRAGREASSSAPAWTAESTPITTAEFPRPRPRPAYSVLGTERDAAASFLAGGPRRATSPSGRCGA